MTDRITTTTGSVTGSVMDGVLQIRIANPGRRNAFTWTMYGELEALLDGLADQPDVRIVTLRGTPEDGFAAGTDIRQFREFDRAEDGLVYERRIAEVIAKLLTVRVPVLGLVEGAAVGAGMVLAACCDLVVAQEGARFGVPIVRTLGNCVPAAVVARLRARVGPPVSDAMLLTGQIFLAEELTATGFVLRLAAPGTLEETAESLISAVTGAAPLSVAGLKELTRRVEALAAVPADEDVLRSCYGSADFKEGVAAFVDRRRPTWIGG